MTDASIDVAEEGPLETRELALRVIRIKGLDEADTVLRTSITYRIIACTEAVNHEQSNRLDHSLAV